ncbi:MAG: bifunctional demethylmenaquinone methyltransferase/2-methoxy-6-polyprenyl-1,4-benzoquinol methylase UbiE [Firmicutes bacterium]|nr:bifunctional demethylmenaquinone methyltransferase/2-methoxy-6-polyprenyl-1,4-benzoquinol methylase UbiE [Bacillota bacterium]
MSLGKMLARKNVPPVPGASEGKAEYVHTLFNSIAGRYDLMNLLMTGGLVKLWHRVVMREAGVGPGTRGLDVCCGTAELALAMAVKSGGRGKITGIDFSEEMLAVAAGKIRRRGLAGRIELVQGNALELPFPDNTFDCATVGFALRNVTDIPKAVAEMARVVKPGGKVVSLDLARPTNRLFQIPYRVYFHHVVPLLGRLNEQRRMPNGQSRPYTYLPNSLRTFPDQNRLAEIFREAGLSDVHYHGLAGAVVAVHTGTKPE